MILMTVKSALPNAEKKEVIAVLEKKEKLVHTKEEKKVMIVVSKAIGIQASDQNVLIRNVIKVVLQVEKIVTHALKKNHRIAIVRLTEKVEVVVAHRANAALVQVLI